jgi:hypothetical protein
MFIFDEVYPQAALQSIAVTLAVVLAVYVNRKYGIRAMLATLVGLVVFLFIVDLAIYGPERYSVGTVAAYFAPQAFAVLVPFAVIAAIVFAMSRRGAHWWPQFFFALLAASLAFTFLLPEAGG